MIENQNITVRESNLVEYDRKWFILKSSQKYSLPNIENDLKTEYAKHISVKANLAENIFCQTNWIFRQWYLVLVKTIFCQAVKYNIFGNVQFWKKIFDIESILEILPMNMYGLALGLEVLECLTPLGKNAISAFYVS